MDCSAMTWLHQQWLYAPRMACIAMTWLHQQQLYALLIACSGQQVYASRDRTDNVKHCSCCGYAAAVVVDNAGQG